MEIINETPFSTATMLWEDLEGKAKLSVIVKVTFSITNKGSIISKEQLPIFTADHHHGDDPLASVRFETDMVPTKPRCDVVLVGRAYAPGGHAITRVDVSLRIGGVQRIIRVFGDRIWSYSNKSGAMPTISDPKPFVTMDLIYERAFGGMDEAAAQYCKENLLGKGFIGKKTVESINGRHLPNIENPYQLISSWESQPKPAGFGFYGRGWLPRLRYAGTYDEKYNKERAPALPLDFSYEILNGAHPDLQIGGYLRGDEEVELINLSPKPVLKFRLPGIRPMIRVSRWAEDPLEWLEQNTSEGQELTIGQVPTTEENVDVALDTLVFVPDEGIFYEVFRGVSPLASLENIEIAIVNVATS